MTASFSITAGLLDFDVPKTWMLNDAMRTASPVRCTGGAVNIPWPLPLVNVGSRASTVKPSSPLIWNFCKKRPAAPDGNDQTNDGEQKFFWHFILPSNGRRLEFVQRRLSEESANSPHAAQVFWPFNFLFASGGADAL